MAAPASSTAASPLRERSRALLAAAATAGALLLAVGCGAGGTQGTEDAAAQAPAASDAPEVAASASPSASPTASASPSAPASATATASPSASASRTASASPRASAHPKAPATASSGRSSGRSSGTTSGTSSAGSSTAGSGGTAAPHFPVPVQVGNATQVITVEASGSYATVTAWAKGPSGWKAEFSTTAGRVGSSGVVDGATRRQNTSTTPSGTYTLTEGFGVAASGTAMPYDRVGSDDWWVEDPDSAYYNSMHSAQGADFPLTEAGVHGSEHLVDHPTQYAEALVIDFNRWPAVPGRGAGIFLHVNGSGATAGCVSVPRATMDRIMSWAKPSAHPRIAIA